MAMDCGQAAERIARTLSGNATPAEDAELKRHLLSCPACRETHSRLSRVWDAMGLLPQIALPREKAAAVTARVAPVRRLRWVAALAAAALLAITGYALLRSPQPTSTPAPETATPTKGPAPVAPEELERNRVERLLTENTPEKKTVESPVTRLPEKQEPRKVETPVPAPVVRTPEPPAPRQPEPKEVVREIPPAPEKSPVQKPVTPERETHAVAATLHRAEGTVLLVTSGTKAPARAGQPIPAGSGIETVGQGSQAVFEYPDGTRLALGSDTHLTQVWDRRAAEGKTIQVAHGLVAAQVVKQPAAEPMIFLTPHAEAKVLGTRLSLSVSAASTRLDVRQGRVKLTRKEDGASADVTEGRFALAGKGLAPVAKAAPGPKIILAEPFAAAKWSPALAQGGDAATGLRFSTETGALSVQIAQKAPPEVAPPIVVPPGTPNAGKLPPDVAKKAIESVARGAALGTKGDLPRALWLETRQTFALSNETPLRIRVRLWQSHSDADRSSWLMLNRAAPGQALTLERRGQALQLWSEATQTILWKKELPCVQEWESLELWLSKDQLVVRRNDLTVHSGANPLKVKVVQVSFGGNAKPELAQDEEARFDDFELSWTTKADLEDVFR